MLSWILQITIISIVLIFLVHYLFNFFKSTLTVPKIKDLVNAPAQKYENMFNIISKGNSDPILSANISENMNANMNATSINNEYTLTDLLPKQETTSDMKNELKNFLKKQMNSTTNVNNTTSISALDSMMSNSKSSSYSDF